MKQTPTRTRQARSLRADMTFAESKLWDYLRGRRLDGLKFRRQAPVAGFIPDFACHEIKLVVELDGGIHRIREAEDSLRDEHITAEGYTVLRSSNEAFVTNPNILLDAIRAHARSGW